MCALPSHASFASSDELLPRIRTRLSRRLFTFESDTLDVEWVIMVERQATHSVVYDY